MTQTSVTGQRHVLVPIRERLSEVLHAAVVAELGIEPVDLEIPLVETPRHDWAIRGLPGDELALTYQVER